MSRAATAPAISTSTIVFHRAALGDFVLIWPWLREWAPVTVVTDQSKGMLAARYLDDVRFLDIESPYWNALWRADATPEPIDSVTRVISYVAGAGSTWAGNAQRAFPNATMEFRSTRPPMRLQGAREASSVKGNMDGPIVIHAGAGGRTKRWAMQRTAELVDLLAGFDLRIALIAGEVEREQFDFVDRALFDSRGGRYVDTLDQLGDIVETARVFIGFDTGPTHLAAAIGVPTLALFGPTDPALWAPIGPMVHTLAPEGVADSMEWLAPEKVAEALRTMLLRI